jgi:hypothetical protein
MPTPNAPHRRNQSKNRRRILVVLATVLAGLVTCAAAVAVGPQLRDTWPVRDRASQFEAAKTVKVQLVRVHRTSADTSRPTRPRSFALMEATPTSVALSWTRSYDNVGVAGYDVYLAGRPTMRTT